MSQWYSYPVQSVSSTNPSVGPNGNPSPAQSTLVAGQDPGGLQQPLQTDASGNLLVNIASGSGPDTTDLVAVGGSAISLGQKTSANSLPVVLPSDGTLPLPTGAATEATLSAFSSKSASSAVTVPFDEQVITYVGATTRIDTVVYKLAGSTVATLTMSYDGSDRLVGVVKT
jgi:hypothetical protein